MKTLKALFCSLIAVLFFSTVAVAAPTAKPAVPSPTPSTNTSFTPAQVQDLHKIIHDYLVQNPNVLVEASQALQQQQMAMMQKQALTAINKNKKQLFNDPQTPVAGNVNGTVYLVEFYDYQCGHCKAMAPVIDQVLKNNANVKLILKDWPIFGGVSKYAAQASIAAYQQGEQKFWAFHDALYNVDGPLSEQTVLDLAKKVGLDTQKLVKDMKDPSINKILRNNFQLAQELRLVGTPGFVVGNKQETNFRFFPGATSLQALQKGIDAVSK